MSTLTSSPSPAASPRTAFTVQQPRRPSSSSSSLRAAAQRSPALNRFSAGSPRRAPNASAPVVTLPQLSRHTVTEPSVASPSSSAYVDAGTQYSPEGFPPTATRKLAAAKGQPSGPASSIATTTRKRKETATDHSPGPMIGTGISSSAGLAPATVANEPRRTQYPSTAPPPGPTPAEPELQEARSTHGHSAAPKRSRPDPGTAKVMPLQYETCDPKDLGILISNMLMELIRINDKIPLRDGRLTRFHSRAPPGISVSDYLQRLIQHATLSPPIMLSMVYYIDRLCTLYPAFTINSLTVHRFLITAATVAAKGLSDSFWTNPTYARIGGIPVSELATLELELLQRVQWKIVPNPEVLEEYYSSLVNRADGYTLEGSSSPNSEGSVLSESESGMRETTDRKADAIMTDDPT